jgi:hypothetical protein
VNNVLWQVGLNQQVWHKAGLTWPPLQGSIVHTNAQSDVEIIIWWIWKQRNTVIFDAGQPNVYQLFSTIQAEARDWPTVDANGLASLLPVGPSS